MTSSASKGADEKFCSECAAIINHKAEICPKCGVRQAHYPASSIPNKDKMVAGFIAIFLGALGIHKFYLNRPLIGILYLFSFTIGSLSFHPILPLFIVISSLVEGIIYFCTSDEDFARKYCSKAST